MSFVYGGNPDPEVYNFSNSQTVEINHNLGYKPWVYIILSDDVQSLGKVVHTNDNTLTVTFQNSQSGSIYLR